MLGRRLFWTQRPWRKFLCNEIGTGWQGQLLEQLLGAWAWFHWFNSHSFENVQEFRLIGIMFGLGACACISDLRVHSHVDACTWCVTVIIDLPVAGLPKLFPKLRFAVSEECIRCSSLACNSHSHVSSNFKTHLSGPLCIPIISNLFKVYGWLLYFHISSL